MIKYLIRLDDACPYMDSVKWQRLEDILEKYGVKPLVGIIPANADPAIMIEPEDSFFWDKVNRWKQKGWSIAMHGYDHCYISESGKNGLNPMWRRSEFSGVSLSMQKEKIRKGVEVLRSHGIFPRFFFAPSHTFDRNTLTALKEESDIRIISDTIATKPYKESGFVFIPQMGGHCSEMKISGIWTFCLHPNTMTDENFAQTESFISNHVGSFISFGQLELDDLKKKDMLSRFISWVYFIRRRIKGIK